MAPFCVWFTVLADAGLQGLLMVLSTLLARFLSIENDPAQLFLYLLSNDVSHQTSKIQVVKTLV